MLVNKSEMATPIDLDWSLQMRLFLILAFTLIQTPSSADEKNSCNQLAQMASVKTSYTDRIVSEDSEHPLTYLKSLSDHKLDQNHNVLGLTVAKPELTYEFKSILSATPEGKVCMVPEITIKSGFSVMQIYLAKELQSNCKRQIIREHEYEHVSTWKNHIRIGTKLMESSMKQAFSQPRYYASTTEAERDLNSWVLEVIQPIEQRLLNGIERAQSAIDSPLSYSRVESRLLTCPQ